MHWPIKGAGARESLGRVENPSFVSPFSTKSDSETFFSLLCSHAQESAKKKEEYFPYFSAPHLARPRFEPRLPAKIELGLRVPLELRENLVRASERRRRNFLQFLFDFRSAASSCVGARDP